MANLVRVLFGLILLAGCGNNIDPTPGEKCKPKWYKNQEDSDDKVVFGYSREKSRSSSLASKKGLAVAQSSALLQINSQINSDLRRGIEEIERQTGEVVAADFSEAVYDELKVSTNEGCNFCVRDKFEECEDGDYMVVYTRVRIEVKKYLDQDLRNQMNDLLEPSRKLLDDLKSK